ncbi:galactose mutarotase [Chlorella sorokiniana]|uniref:Galactose mutarotase n=1 Tax=Chlorella sorokiniana TaxID=3076 RepID=A0A2P6TT56_CHLSO|nr:galactose mutarotase [Chlorella sorokiniana]|eukprot:PRW57248.1 galactose mutarotase [Chlorella sorokiniana]
MARFLLAAACILAWLSAARAADIVLRNANGMEVAIIPTGACVRRLLLPAADGPPVDVMMGFEEQDADKYRNGTSVSGCIVGRVGGRISATNFTLDGVTYPLDAGKGGYVMHGGGTPYTRREWQVVDTSPQSAVLALDSPAGDQGFPGNLSVQVTYTLTDDNALSIDIRATTDEPTPVNIFSHPYFNLAGVASNDSSILDHIFTVNASHYVATDDSGAATGAFDPVVGGPLDFTEPHTIGERINETDGGYSVSYLLFGTDPDAADEIAGFQAAAEPQLAATLLDPASGRGLDILTTAPALVFFTGNFKPKDEFKYGVRPTNKHAAVALETTMFSEGVVQPGFPDLILQPGEEYQNQVVWRFFQQAPSAAGGVERATSGAARRSLLWHTARCSAEPWTCKLMPKLNIAQPHQHADALLAKVYTERLLQHITSSRIPAVHVDAALAQLGALSAFRQGAARPIVLADVWAARQQAAASCAAAIIPAAGVSTDAEDVAPKLPAASPYIPPARRQGATAAVLAGCALAYPPICPTPTTPAQPAQPAAYVPPQRRTAEQQAAAAEAGRPGVVSRASLPARSPSRLSRRRCLFIALPCCTPASAAAADSSPSSPALLRQACLL